MSSMISDEQPTLSASARAEIDHWLKKFPPEQKRSVVEEALTIVQKENGGWLTEALMDAVADYLSIPRIAVYEVASFYSLYELKPIGRHKISLCTNISCKLRGASQIADHLCKRLGVQLGETTADGKFTLREVECLAACVNAPVLQVNDTVYHEDLTADKVDTILASLDEE